MRFESRSSLTPVAIIILKPLATSARVLSGVRHGESWLVDALVLRAEATTPDALERIKGIIAHELAKFPEVGTPVW